MLKVLVVAQTPPPYGGALIMVERFLRADYEDVQLTHVQMLFFNLREASSTKGASRIWKIASLSCSLPTSYIAVSPTGRESCTLPPGGPNRVSMFRDIVVLIYESLVVRQDCAPLSPGRRFRVI